MQDDSSGSCVSHKVGKRIGNSCPSLEVCCKRGLNIHASCKSYIIFGLFLKVVKTLFVEVICCYTKGIGRVLVRTWLCFVMDDTMVSHISCLQTSVSIVPKECVSKCDHVTSFKLVVWMDKSGINVAVERYVLPKTIQIFDNWCWKYSFNKLYPELTLFPHLSTSVE